MTPLSLWEIYAAICLVHGEFFWILWCWPKDNNSLSLEILTFIIDHADNIDKYISSGRSLFPSNYLLWRTRSVTSISRIFQPTPCKRHGQLYGHPYSSHGVLSKVFGESICVNLSLTWDESNPRWPLPHSKVLINPANDCCRILHLWIVPDGGAPQWGPLTNHHEWPQRHRQVTPGPSYLLTYHVHWRNILSIERTTWPTPTFRQENSRWCQDLLQQSRLSPLGWPLFMHLNLPICWAWKWGACTRVYHKYASISGLVWCPLWSLRDRSLGFTWGRQRGHCLIILFYQRPRLARYLSTAMMDLWVTISCTVQV